ncbi:rho guanine nucleotide exchange factor TIAM1-like isoform X2 [Lethenteron reissneri]|nr:rho guanine nucleotide exchange factor TIAM1-like isoform X2 [Lethenteron reissneri]
MGNTGSRYDQHYHNNNNHNNNNHDNGSASGSSGGGAGGGGASKGRAAGHRLRASGRAGDARGHSRHHPQHQRTTAAAAATGPAHAPPWATWSPQSAGHPAAISSGGGYWTLGRWRRSGRQKPAPWGAGGAAAGGCPVPAGGTPDVEMEEEPDGSHVVIKAASLARGVSVEFRKRCRQESVDTTASQPSRGAAGGAPPSHAAKSLRVDRDEEGRPPSPEDMTFEPAWGREVAAAAEDGREAERRSPPTPEPGLPGGRGEPPGIPGGPRAGWSQTLPCRKLRKSATRPTPAADEEEELTRPWAARETQRPAFLSGSLPRRRLGPCQAMAQGRARQEGSDSGIDLPSHRSSLEAPWGGRAAPGGAGEAGAVAGGARAEGLGHAGPPVDSDSSGGSSSSGGGGDGGGSYRCGSRCGRSKRDEGSSPGAPRDGGPRLDPSWIGPEPHGGSMGDCAELDGGDDSSSLSLASDGAAGTAREATAVRRTGWLWAKRWLVRGKAQRVQLSPRRKWRRCWAALRGCTLLLYDSVGGGATTSPGEGGPCEVGGACEAGPPGGDEVQEAVSALGALVQAVPEHPRREHVFCLSNSRGEAFLLQAGSQSELENWATAVHSACAAREVRGWWGGGTAAVGEESRCGRPRRGPGGPGGGVVPQLEAAVRRLAERADLDAKMHKMAELQAAATTDARSRRAIAEQIRQWELNVESVHVRLFRYRCYAASLRGGEPPNPKGLLSVTSRLTKAGLARLGAFTASSLHATVCARDDFSVRDRSLSLPRGDSRRRGLISALLGPERVRLSPAEAAGGSASADVGAAAPVPDSGFALLGDPQRAGFPDGGHEGVEEVEAVEEVELVPEAQAMTKPQDDVGPPPPALDACDLGSPDGDSDPDPNRGHDLPLPRQLSETEKLRKVIVELLETERTYGRDLKLLMDQYLEPLQTQPFLTPEELSSLFGRLREMESFQRVFVRALEEGAALGGLASDAAAADHPAPHEPRCPVRLRRALFSLGGTFLYYAEHFKLYSAFCASHSRAQRILAKARTEAAFCAFLEERNPGRQHASSLESLLIKPVQRVLKYPLLLRQLAALAAPHSHERHHLTEAMRAMNGVARHINEMQKLYDEFGAAFDGLLAQQPGPCREVSELSMAELIGHDSVTWLNPPAHLGRHWREPQLTLLVFRPALVLLCKDQTKPRKKGGPPRSPRCTGPEDALRFAHMVPATALQLRAGSTTQDDGISCIWEVIHVRSETEGRPEAAFHVCSPSLERKLRVVRMVEQLLKAGARGAHGSRWGGHGTPHGCHGEYVPYGGQRLAALRGGRAALHKQESSWSCASDPDAGHPESPRAARPSQPAGASGSAPGTRDSGDIPRRSGDTDGRGWEHRPTRTWQRDYPTDNPGENTSRDGGDRGGGGGVREGGGGGVREGGGGGGGVGDRRLSPGDERQSPTRCRGGHDGAAPASPALDSSSFMRELERRLQSTFLCDGAPPPPSDTGARCATGGHAGGAGGHRPLARALTGDFTSELARDFSDQSLSSVTSEERFFGVLDVSL